MTIWRILPKADRRLFYSLLSAQVEAGFVASRACRELAALEGLPRGIHALADAGGQAEREGHTVVDGLARTGRLPAEDLAILTIAERYGSLPEALRRLSSRDEQIPGVFGQIVVPNLYFVAIGSLLVFLIANAAGFFTQMRLPGFGNPLYDASLALQSGLPAALGIGGLGLAAGIWIVKCSTGSLRRLLEPFDTIERLRIGIRFCYLAALMAHNGAVGKVILENMAEIFRKDRYLHHHAVRAHGRIVSEGARLEDALADGVLKPRYAAMLGGLVPGGTLERYEMGYRTLAEVQRQMLDRQLGLLVRLVRILLLGGILLGFAQLLDGIYSMYDSVSTYA